MDRNDRPRPVVSLSDGTPSLDRLVKDARAAEGRIADAEGRIADLEQATRRTAKSLLFENLDQALRIEAAVEQHGQSVAAFARQAGIEERRAQRLYKLAARTPEIGEEVRAGEEKYGDDYVCPSWKRFLKSEPADHKQDDDGTGLAKGLIVDDLNQQLGAALARIDELKSANKLATTAREELERTLQTRRPLYGVFVRGDPEREAPQWLFDHYNREFRLTLDVAATAENAKCPQFFTKAENGLMQIWSGNVWLNPPYSEIEPWCKKAWEYAQTGKGVVVALLPIWPTASWFREFVIHGHIRLLTSRFSAVGTKTLAPFSFMIVVWTTVSQCKDGRPHVTMEDVPDPKKVTRAARSAAKSVVKKKAVQRR
jgi:site-specific DNA-methyltransferase (adenine-specific)